MLDNITILLLVSRNDFLERILTSIELLECNNMKTSLIVIVDGDNKLFLDVRNVVEFSKYDQSICIQYKSKEKKSQFDVMQRRKRISAIHNFAKEYINDNGLIMGIEDDTIVPHDALIKMHKEYIYNNHIGFIQGIELGRWGIPYLGAWLVNDIYDTTSIKSTLLLEGIHEVDAGGFYCFMTRTDTYLNHTFKPFENNDLGPDVDFGITLRRNGLINYTDYSIKCIHLDKDKELIIGKEDIQIVNLIKADNRWRQNRI